MIVRAPGHYHDGWNGEVYAVVEGDIPYTSEEQPGNEGVTFCDVFFEGGIARYGSWQVEAS